MRLIVYGTLRQGEALSYVLPKGGRFETVEISGLRLYVLGACPGAKLGDKEDKAIVDIWEFNDNKEVEARLLHMLDRIEGVSSGLYKRSYIDTPRGTAVVYTVCGSVDGCLRIKDWKEWQKKSTAEQYELLDKAGGAKSKIYIRAA